MSRILLGVTGGIAAYKACELAPEFDYTVVNDDRERAVGELEGIVRSALDGAGTMPAHDPSPH